mgnify:CR=1 FL=1
MKIKGVFFDLGGTLFQYTSSLGGGLKHLLSQLDINLTSKEIGVAWAKASKKAALRFSSESFFLHKDLFREMIVSFGNSFGHKVSEPLVEEFNQNQLKALLQSLPHRRERRHLGVIVRQFPLVDRAL